MTQDDKVKVWTAVGDTLGKMMSDGDIPVVIIGIDTSKSSGHRFHTMTHNVGGLPAADVAAMLRTVADRIDHMSRERDAAPNN